ncbi:hypothetical protein G7Y89_g4024 [Cudoniella acicularis]|uniref:Uncharacterized protein n=1 Tax=Cudoniella acicularis TaxID=354080 RepID=A0A8H4RRL7_9HELO|nr:hypothetical protein G7Y89_g4024 [Cudoniella acicularis]
MPSYHQSLRLEGKTSRPMQENRDTPVDRGFAPARSASSMLSLPLLAAAAAPAPSCATDASQDRHIIPRAHGSIPPPSPSPRASAAASGCMYGAVNTRHGRRELGILLDPAASCQLPTRDLLTLIRTATSPVAVRSSPVAPPSSAVSYSLAPPARRPPRPGAHGSSRRRQRCPPLTAWCCGCSVVRYGDQSENASFYVNSPKPVPTSRTFNVRCVSLGPKLRETTSFEPSPPLVMTSTERNGRPLIARRNTFQRMLDLERKNKVNRMQASTNTALIPHSRTSTTQGQDVNTHRDQPPAALQTHGRAMTAPTLALTIPTELSKDGPTKKYVIKQGNVVPMEEAESDVESDRSSICHSPGWDDLTGKKRKKEKREAKEKLKMEKEKQDSKEKLKVDKKKIETEAKHAHRIKNRLSKAPPTNPRLSKMAVTLDRSSSSPNIETLPEPAEAKEDTKKSGNRSRRGSLDIGFKSLFSSAQSIPALWKHNQVTPPQASPSKDSPSPSTGKSAAVTTSGSPMAAGTGNGFIGGLKLRLSEEAAAHDRTRKSISILKYDDQRGLLDTDQDSTPTASRGTSVRDSSTDPSFRIRPVNTTSFIYNESVRTPQQWESIYTQAGRTAREAGSSGAIPDDVPIMQRNIKKNKKARASVSGYMPSEPSPPLDSASPKRDSFSASKSHISLAARPRTSEDLSSYGSRRPSPPTEKRTRRSRERSQDPRTSRENHGGYVQDQRKQSQDGAIAMFEDECRVTNSPDSTTRGRSLSFHSVKSRVSSSGEAPSTARQEANNDIPAMPESDKAFSFFSEYTPPELHLHDHSPTSLTPRHQKKESKGLKGFKIAAKAAFSRQSTELPSSTITNNPNLNDTSTNSSSRPTSQRASTIELMDGISSRSSRAERISGEDVPSVKDSSQRPPSSGRKSKNGPPTLPLKHFGHLNEDGVSSHKKVNSHTRTTTDSSEEYSTLDEFSNVTTPIASRPQSQKEYSPPVINSPLMASTDTRAARSTNSLPGKKLAMMSGAIPHNEAMNRSQDSWSRTAMPMDLTDDEERLRTPTGNQPNSDSSATLTDSTQTTKSDEIKRTSSAGVQRHPSISRSVSTPELQDLSFLPALKHQALTKPPRKKGKGVIMRKKSGSRASGNKDLIKPPAIPIASIKPEDSSPDSPTGGQYLRDARMHIPRPPPRSPNRNRFPGGPSTPQPSVDPIAKMFVVCCSCKYFHDMPSKIYECMAKPDNVVEDKNLGVSGVISTSVKCPWCGHGMSTTCCSGYAAVVYLREKLH